ncbi:hypothetical protein [Streptomyces narbonensis]|uniref:Uncharacterized protein n=1 Tax=Streptomyces narbonensis TaxID=67333 RepID=A0ABV3CGZ7_9ACTN
MVIIRPAIPSETAKLDPIEVSKPIGRISVVTIEKIPSITETTANQDRKGERSGGSAEGDVERVVAVDTGHVLKGGRLMRKADCAVRGGSTSPAGAGIHVRQDSDADVRPGPPVTRWTRPHPVEELPGDKALVPTERAGAIRSNDL